MIVGTTARYQTETGETAASQYETRCSLPELYCLTLFSPQYCFSTHGSLVSEETKGKRKRKPDLMKEACLTPAK